MKRLWALLGPAGDILGPLAPYLVGAGLLVAAVLWIDHKGYQRAQDANENRRRDEHALAVSVVAHLDRTMADVISKTDAAVGDRLNRIRITNQTILQPELIKEIRSDPRFSDPAAGISDGMLKQINAARALSSPSGPDGSIEVPLPPARPAGG